MEAQHKGMKSYWEVWLCDDRGVRLDLLDDLLYLELAIPMGVAGVWKIGLGDEYDRTLLRTDAMLEFWRGTEQSKLKRLSVGWLRKRRTASGVIEIGGPTVLQLLERRVVAYSTGSTDSDLTGKADDVMKTLVSKNLGSGAAAARDLTSLGLSVAPNLSLGPDITYSFALKTVLEALKSVYDSSVQAGNPVYYDLAPVQITDNQIGFNFRTYINQPGIDRTQSTGGANHRAVGTDYGNFENGVLDEDYSTDVNYVYVGTYAEKVVTIKSETQDAARLAASAWNRWEAFAECRDAATTDEQTSVAQEALNKGRYARRIEGELVETPSFRYGIDWEWGDKLTVQFAGQEFDEIVRTVGFAVDSSGQETIKAQIGSAGLAGRPSMSSWFAPAAPAPAPKKPKKKVKK